MIYGMIFRVKKILRKVFKLNRRSRLTSRKMHKKAIKGVERYAKKVREGKIENKNKATSISKILDKNLKR